MTGYYKRANDEELAQVQNGELSAEFMTEGEFLETDKAWHTLHYAITGSADEIGNILDKAVIGGEPTNDEDFGYGPILFCSSEDVKELSVELAKITDEQFTSRLDYETMASEGVFMAEYADDEEYMLSLFAEVKALFDSAAKNGENVLFCMM